MDDKTEYSERRLDDIDKLNTEGRAENKRVHEELDRADTDPRRGVTFSDIRNTAAEDVRDSDSHAAETFEMFGDDLHEIALKEDAERSRKASEHVVGPLDQQN